jgi:beta-glucosidase
VLGHVEPAGRLPVSIPRHVGQQPTYYNQVRGQHGHRYADLTQDPQFVFGEGLGYTTVEWSEPAIEQAELVLTDVLVAEVTLTNTGRRPAHEVVQAYVTDVVTSVTWAAKELKAFRRVTVPAGESVRVRLDVPAAACSIVDAAGRRIVEPGEFRLLVGRSSREADLRGVTFTITPGRDV